MRCIIPSGNVKIIARCLHSLARIGDDLFLNATSKGLSFRTVNSAQSAYSTFTFNECFFSTFHMDQNDESSVQCKISVKSCLTVFKTPHCMDKNVESCQMEVNNDCAQLVIKLKYVKGFVKTFFIPVLDNENIQLKYSKEGMTNNLCILSKYLCNAVKHFRVHDDEITLSVNPQKAYLKNYFENCEDKKLVRTELCLQIGDFEMYSVKSTASITFSLRELRAIISFSEIANFPVGIFFETAGKPVIFTISNDPVYKANYVVSTLPPGMMSCDIRDDRCQVMADDASMTMPSATTQNHNHATANDKSSTQIAPREISLMDEHNLSNSMINELLSACPVVSNHSYRDSTEDIIRIQKIRNVFKRCFTNENDVGVLPASRNVLVYDSDGLIDSD